MLRIVYVFILKTKTPSHITHTDVDMQTRPYAAHARHSFAPTSNNQACFEFLHRLIIGSPSPLPPLIFLFLLSTSIASTISILCGSTHFNLHLLSSQAFLTPPSLPPLSVGAILVLGGGHRHASLSGLINRPRSWQPGLHQGPMACFFLFSYCRKHEF